MKVFPLFVDLEFGVKWDEYHNQRIGVSSGLYIRPISISIDGKGPR